MSGSPVPAAPFLFEPERANRLDALVADLDPAALAWLSGYAAGLAAERARAGAARPVAAPRADAAPRAPEPVAKADAPAAATVLYGSQTGNSRRLAERLARSLEATGLQPTLVSAADYPPKRLADERLLYVVVSTHGDGEPPDDARALFDFLGGRKAPALPQLRYAVLALGDSSYPQFCATGRVLDERLAALGGRRLVDRVDCDVDFEPAAAPWLEQAVATARTETGAAAPRLAVVTPLRAPAQQPATREHPVDAELVANQRITARDAEKDVRHLELALPEQRFEYEPGDALGVLVDNPAETVTRVLELARLDPTTAVTIDGQTHALAHWLARRREVTKLAKPLVERLAERTDAARAAELRAWLQPGGTEHLRRAFKELQVADLLKRFPAAWEPEAFVRALQPLQPRLYSIASSRRAVDDEAHLTVAVVDYEHDGERRRGAASWQLATLASGTRVRAYVEPNPRFRLPADGARDVIMIGPGTGVAPFRGFLQQRVADGARGCHWLFFGGRHLERDFLYQVEWLEALKKKQLQRLDVAFSRDQATKLYVQHRLREHGAELFRWLEGGAHLYVCGDAERMAPDVHAALLDVVATHGGRDADGAREYLSELVAQKRYARDVY
jgi:sulfite reductase (NADPH) flavoprotein alpha-component